MKPTKEQYNAALRAVLYPEDDTEEGPSDLIGNSLALAIVKAVSNEKGEASEKDLKLAFLWAEALLMDFNLLTMIAYGGVKLTPNKNAKKNRWRKV